MPLEDDDLLDLIGDMDEYIANANYDAAKTEYTKIRDYMKTHHLPKRGVLDLEKMIVG